MKNIFLIIGLVSLIFTSCDKTSEGVSSITTFPVITINGDEAMFVLTNSPYTDAGAVAVAGEDELPVTTRGSVDTKIPGFYAIVYSAVNAEGYPATATRSVFVVDKLPSVDYSGSYQIVHATRTNKSMITKNGGLLGYYHATDTWFQASAIPVDFYDKGDGTFTVLPGSSNYGEHVGSGLFLPDNQIKFNMTLLNQGPLNYTTTWKLLQ